MVEHINKKKNIRLSFIIKDPSKAGKIIGRDSTHSIE